MIFLGLPWGRARRRGSRRSVTALESGVITSHLLGDQVIGLEDRLLGGGIELIPGSKYRRLLHEVGNYGSVRIDHGRIKELNGFLVRIDGDLTNTVTDVGACLQVCSIPHAEAHEVIAAGPHLPVGGKNGDRVGASVLKVGVVAAEPIRRGYVGDVDLDIVVRGDEKRSGPLLGLVEHLRRSAEGAMLENLLAERPCGEEQQDEELGSEELEQRTQTQGHSGSLSHKYIGQRKRSER